MHGTHPDKVHFHEVGAVDAICDIVGTAVGLHELGLDALMFSTVSLGGGLTDLGACGTAADRPITFEDFVPTAERSGGPLRQADVDANGDYSIEMLPAGLYSMDYLAKVGVAVGAEAWTISFSATHADQVSVAIGVTVTADYEITDVGCAIDNG